MKNNFTIMLQRGAAMLLMILMVIATAGAAVPGKKGEVLTGKVVKVADGDTFTLLVKGNRQVRVRLYGIDAPEMTGGQPFCRRSKDKLAELVAGKQVSVLVKSYDRYKRALGIVSTDRCKDVNLEMLKSGLAWHYKRYDRTPAYIQAAQQAKAHRKGIWSDKHQPVQPETWRRIQKK